MYFLDLISQNPGCIEIQVLVENCSIIFMYSEFENIQYICGHIYYSVYCILYLFIYIHDGYPYMFHGVM